MKGKSYLITGVSSAIGQVAAMDLLEKGASVYGTYNMVNSDAYNRLNSMDGITLIKWSVFDDPDFMSVLPDLDGWIHCIGVINPMPIKYLKKEGKEDLLYVNFTAAANLSSALLKEKKLAKHASIVFLSSISSHAPYRGGAIYASSKAALETFAKALALEVSDRKIRVNVLSCGLVNSPMYAHSKSFMSPNEVQRIEGKYPLGIGEPEQVSKFCLFLLSADSSWMTGSILNLDGGLMLNVNP